MGTHNGMKFTTFDSDNDLDEVNCAVKRGGGFWWRKCGPARITTSKPASGIKAFGWKELPGDSLLQTSRGWVMCL